MGRKRKGQLQAAPNYDSGRSKLAQLYEQQEQQKRGEQPQQQQERQQQQQPQNRQEQPGWGTNRLIVAGIIAVPAVILLTALALLVAKSLSIADQRAEECLQRYDSLTTMTTILHETMKVQLEDSHDEINGLKPAHRNSSECWMRRFERKHMNKNLYRKS